MKLYVITIISAVVIIIGVIGFALLGKAEQNENIIDNYTMGDIEEIMTDYMKANEIDIDLHSNEYLEFITLQAIEGIDRELEKHPQYPLIHAYMAHYITVHQKYITGGEYSPQDTKFKRTTIRDLKKMG